MGRISRLYLSRISRLYLGHISWLCLGRIRRLYQTVLARFIPGLELIALALTVGHMGSKKLGRMKNAVV